VSVDYNPFDPTQVDDHFDVLAQLRAECPVAEVMPGVFYVSRYDDVVEITRNHKVFGQGGFHPLDEDTRHPDQKELGETDPPFHTVVRKNLALALSPGRTKSFEPIVRDACARHGSAVRRSAILSVSSNTATVRRLRTDRLPRPTAAVTAVRISPSPPSAGRTAARAPCCR